MENHNAKKQKSVVRELLSWFLVIAVAVAAALVIDHVVIVNAQVPSSSMETTIMTGERVVGSRLTYDFSKPKRGDIAIFRFPDDESQIYIKRVIGLPGETVTVKGGKVYINDSATPLDEAYLHVVPTGDSGPFKVPDDAYFMMGDNRNVSYDSRYWQNHYVKRDKILAKAIFGYYPKVFVLK